MKEMSSPLSSRKFINEFDILQLINTEIFYPEFPSGSISFLICLENRLILQLGVIIPMSISQIYLLLWGKFRLPIATS